MGQGSGTAQIRVMEPCALNLFRDRPDEPTISRSQRYDMAPTPVKTLKSVIVLS